MVVKLLLHVGNLNCKREVVTAGVKVLLHL